VGQKGTIQNKEEKMKFNEIPYDELITCDFWLNDLAEGFDWNPGDEVRSVTFLEPSKTFEFFQHCQSVRRPIIVISGASDFGINDQFDNHPNKDIEKIINGMALTPFHPPKDKYIGIPQINAPVNNRTSNPLHIHSVKMDRYTICTFDEIPHCIKHWFCSNLNSKLPQAELIPFGLAPSHDPKQTRDYFSSLWGAPCHALIYLNFSDYTVERILLKKHYAGNESFHISKRNDLSAKDYIDELAHCESCLCPPGNGIGCYRELECWYTGVVPIMKNSMYSQHIALSGLPVHIVDDLFNIDIKKLEEYLLSNPFETADLTRLTKSFWRKRLEEAKREYT